MQQDSAIGLLDRAASVAISLRSASQVTRDPYLRSREMQTAALIEDLIKYAMDRDKALSQRVRDCALLRARLEATTHE